MFASVLLCAFLISGVPVKAGGEAENPVLQGPLAFGRVEIEAALKSAGLSDRSGAVSLSVTRSGASESFALRFRDGEISVEGADEAGAMYGALEAAERIRLRGDAAFEGESVTASPWLANRGLNLFLTLPWDYAAGDSDYDSAALTDPERWWFHNDDYWRTLFDVMARSRLNWLDLHGTWDVSVTNAPNLYAYFIQSVRFPKVGVAPAIKTANLERLNRIIAMAHDRGIRISLMAYEARFAIPHNPSPPYGVNEENIYLYTREVVEKMIRWVPGLDAIGFRIGESGRRGDFFKCYLEAVERSGRDIPLLTRSWITRKAAVVPLARDSSDFTVEIKFNGEQWGAPYLLTGGRVPGWYSYSFEDYLSDSGMLPARKVWPGHPAEGGGKWPDQPYKVVWQVRAGGTHRIFPFYDPEWVRRTIGEMKIGTASGFTVEPLNAYYPASPRYYLADGKDAWCHWIHERDFLYCALWGRLGYDPHTAEEVFDALLFDRLGGEHAKLVAAWKWASRVVPTAFCAFSIGPDHRNHAPEMEWGGRTEDFILREPFDSFSFMSIKEAFALAATGGNDGRLTPLDAALRLAPPGGSDSGAPWTPPPARPPLQEMPPPAGTMAREIWAAASQLYSLADYYAGRFSTAWLQAARDGEGESAGAHSLQAAAGEARKALVAWQALSDSPAARFYKPFTERLRMHTNRFHWRNELEGVRKEMKKHVEAARNAGAEPIDATRGGGLVKPGAETVLSWREENGEIVCTIPASGLKNAWLLTKPLPSSTFYHKVPMIRDGAKGLFAARFGRLNCGHCAAAEIEFMKEGAFGTTTHVRRIPLWEEEAPAIIIPARQGPTPAYYSSQEAMTYLDPVILDPARYGLLLICSRAWDFHSRFDVPVQRKLLDAVEKGLDILVLQQDYTSGRYPLDWLPWRPTIMNSPSKIFDPGGALGLERIEANNILWQRFRPSHKWDVFGNGGVARYRHGEGSVWIVQARLMQNMQRPACARALARLLCLGGREKPTVVIDAGSEGAHYATSVFVDMMNAQSVPFLTLGEVIAAEQGTDCFEPVPGRRWDDRVLDGRGPELVRIQLDGKVKSAAARPIAETAEEFEEERPLQREKLLRCLGLRPFPQRCPLEARVTGVLQRDGYRVEKIVFESRPRFPVTATLYASDEEGKLPVIVNPHGHWRNKKAEGCVQARAIAQARAGFIALVVDSPGYSFEGDALIERRSAGTHHNLRYTLGSTTATSVYVWDLIRALDYLETRSDTDMSRVGITGASGGGLATVYAFAADERFTCAVPVCFASSLEVNYRNGCPCNHVPGTLRIGDRSDVLAIRAPAPLFVIGAGKDPEFPPDGIALTGEKLKKIWGLFYAEESVHCHIFDAVHGYDKAMREAALGFFNRYLKGGADMKPLPEADLETPPPGAEELICLHEKPEGQLTMGGIAAATLGYAAPKRFGDVISLNGGLPERVSFILDIPEKSGSPSGSRHVAIDSEPGMKIPGLLWLPDREPRGAAIFISERGKVAALEEFPVEALVAKGIACLTIDVRGYGELCGLDPRLLAYLGTAAPFLQGWDALAAAEAMRSIAPRVAVVGRGACAAQAVLFAALIGKETGRDVIDFVAGLDGIRHYGECFSGEVPLLAVQPRAAYGVPLETLRSLVTQSEFWTFRGDGEVDLIALIEQQVGG